jgi:hypothetical protein
MTVKQLNINGLTYLCVVTPYENNRINAGHKVNIPADRKVKMRLGIPRSMQLRAAGIAAPPVVF